MYDFVPLDPFQGRHVDVGRGFAISRNGRNIAGTFIVNDGEDLPRWWKGHRSSSLGSWTFTTGKRDDLGGLSARGINDAGDMAGFYGKPRRPWRFFAGLDIQPIPFQFPFTPPHDLENPYLKHDVAIFTIDNTRLLVGAYLDEEWPQRSIGFEWRAYDGTFGYMDFQFSDPIALEFEPHGINVHGDLVGSRSLVSGFVYLNPPGPLADPNADTYFIDLMDVLTSSPLKDDPALSDKGVDGCAVFGINALRVIVGTVKLDGFDNGFVASVDSAGIVSHVKIVNYPGSTGMGTHLAGISDAGIIIGTYGDNLPFLCVPKRNWLTDVIPTFRPGQADFNPPPPP